MGLFSKIFKPKVGDKSRETIALLQRWVQSHFSDSNYTYGYRRTPSYQTHCTDSGEKISLSQIKTPLLEADTSPKTFFEKLKALAHDADRPYLPVVLGNYHNRVHQEISRFQGNLKKLSCLSRNIQDDALFPEIDYIFDAKLRILYNELLFCKFENLGNADYFRKVYSRMDKLCRDLQSLNTDFTDYMYALSNNEYENTQKDLEMIRTRVAAMSDVAEKYTKEL